MSITTGWYIVTNVKQRNVALLTDPNEATPLSASPRRNSAGEIWHIDRLANENYIFQNVGNNSYANAGICAKEEDNVEGRKQQQEWEIQETGNKGLFTYKLYYGPQKFGADVLLCSIATTDTHVFWGLIDNQPHTPIALSSVATDTRNCWTFTPISEAQQLVARLISGHQGAIFRLESITYPPGSQERMAAFEWKAIDVLVPLIHPSGGDIPEGTPASVMTDEVRRMSIDPSAKLLESACKTLANICAGIEHARTAAFYANAMPPLVCRLSHGSVQVQSAAAYALSHVAKFGEAAAAVPWEGATDVLIRHLKERDRAIQKRAAHSLGNFYVASSQAIKLTYQNAIPLLLDLIDVDPTYFSPVVSWALRHINGDEEAKKSSIKAGAIRYLIQFLKLKDDVTLINACKALALICMTDNDARLIAWKGDAMTHLVEKLSHTNSSVQTDALEALQWICKHPQAAADAALPLIGVIKEMFKKRGS